MLNCDNRIFLIRKLEKLQEATHFDTQDDTIKSHCLHVQNELWG